jgi:RNA polymerase sigma factor (sigma-70 family)
MEEVPSPRWLTRIAINNALMLLRKKRSQPVYSFEADPPAKEFKFPEPPETSHNPEESFIQNALDNELAKAVRKLSPSLREVILHRYREHATVAQITKTLGISESAAKSRLFRATSKIRRYLDKKQCLDRAIDSRTATGFQLLSAFSRPVTREQNRNSGMGDCSSVIWWSKQ